MQTKDVDLYLERVERATSEAEKLEATKEFYKLINESIAKTNNNRYISRYTNIDKDLINYCVESGALNVCHKIGFSKILDLTRVLSAILDISDLPNKEASSKKMFDDIEQFLETKDFEGVDLNIYDGIVTRYFHDCIERNKPIDELGKSAVNRLFSNLPEGMSHKDTMLYKTQLLRASRDRDDIFELIPKASIESYETYLFNPDLKKNGKIVNFNEYDNLMYEYLSFYGTRGMVDIDKKSQLFQNIIDNSKPGDLNRSKTYSLYFMKSDYEDDQKVTFSFNGVIAKDVLARIHETNGKDTHYNEFEFFLFEKFYLPRIINWEKEDPEFFNRMKETDPNISPEQELPGDLELHLGELFVASSIGSVELAKYAIRLQNIFNISDRPKNKDLAKVYDYVKSIDIFSLLKKNLAPEKLKDYEKIDRDTINEFLGIQETEEERQKRLEEEKENEGIDYNVDKDGLRKIDYADIALSLMLESDFEKGLLELSTKEIEKTFYENGRNIHDSRAIRKLVELYVQKPELQKSNPLLEDQIFKYVLTVSSKPDFNLFTEQGISDLMQLANTQNSAFGRSISSLLKKSLTTNPNYSMSLQDANQYVNDFMNNVGETAIDSSKEAEFDKFLVALTQIRLSSKNGIFSQEATDFLLNQALRPNSIINTMNEKYSGVSERALENLGKLDNVKQNNGQLSYIYIVRDYIDRDITLGLHGANCITVKRENVKKLANGEFDAIETIFHENTHMNQAIRIKQIPQSFKDYIMIKEDIIRFEREKYYDQNYRLFYKEIEAREKSEQKTAEYIGQIIPKDRTEDFVENLRDDIAEMFSTRYKEEQKRYISKSKLEGKLYDEGLIKIDKDGAKRPISEIFDRYVDEFSISTYMKKYPGLVLEYNDNGTKRSLSEQILFANANKERINLQMMREIIKNAGTAQTSTSLEPLVAVKRLIINAKSKEDIEFINGIVGDNFPIAILNYGKKLSTQLKDNTRRLTINDLDDYLLIKEFVDAAEKNPQIPWLEGFNVTTENGITTLHMLQVIKSTIEKANPNIGAISDNYKAMKQQRTQTSTNSTIPSRKSNKKSFFSNKFHKSYEQLQEIEADVEGMQTVAQYEIELEDREKTGNQVK